MTTVAQILARRAFFVHLLFVWYVSPLSVLLAVDDDGDGMSDVWQTKYGIAVDDLFSDPDRDGYSNRVEEAFRTDPLYNGAPTLYDDMFGLPVFIPWEDVPKVQWLTVYGVPYVLMRSGNLVDWEEVQPTVLGDGHMVTLEMDEHTYATDPIQFLRLEARNPGDEDGDGLDAWEEAELGTDDTKTDSDEDGLLDILEYRTPGSEPGDPDSDGDGIWDGEDDLDSDGSINSHEQAVKRNLAVKDHPAVKLNVEAGN